MNYNDFLKAKSHLSHEYGIDVNFIPNQMFPYQKHVLEYLVKKGRAACFLDTGLGKTLIELATAQNYFNKIRKPVLIITPLAVAFQFIKEAEKFGINSISYSKDGKFDSNIVVCNYERLDKFNSNDFDCVILDESSILKNFKGAIKNRVTSFMKKVKYRFLFTATPSPNDFVELGTSSEALGYLGYTDMLTKFFTNNEDTISPQNIGTKWILKGHAKEDFFRWVSSWSISMRKPSDLGFDDSEYKLPKLITNFNPINKKILVSASGQFSLFNIPARRLTDIKSEERQTIIERCERAVEIASKRDCSVYWVNFNKEAELIKSLDKNAVEVSGSMDIDKKEEILLAFAEGKIKKLITKSKITAFGLNWQHCNHTVFFPTFSYEQYYQSIRRFWRFGQTKDVIVDLVYCEGQQRVLDGLIAKSEKANELFNKLNSNINATFNIDKKEFNHPIKLPNFLKND